MRQEAQGTARSARPPPPAKNKRVGALCTSRRSWRRRGNRRPPACLHASGGGGRAWRLELKIAAAPLSPDPSARSRRRSNNRVVEGQSRVSRSVSRGKRFPAHRTQRKAAGAAAKGKKGRGAEERVRVCRRRVRVSRWFVGIYIPCLSSHWCCMYMYTISFFDDRLHSQVSGDTVHVRNVALGACVLTPRTLSRSLAHIDSARFFYCGRSDPTVGY